MYLKSIVLFAIILCGNLLFAQGSNPNYQWVHPQPYGASVGWIKAWDTNTIYAVGTAGNFIKSTDGGQTFTPNPNAGVPNAAPNPTTGDMRAASFLNMNVGYICGTYGVTKTTDGGETFTEVGAGNFPYTELRDIHFFNENTGYVLGSYSDAFAKTTDGGNTWVKSTTLPQDYYYDMIVFNEQRIIVSGSYSGTSNIYLTTDGGATWTASAAGSLSIFSMTFLDSLTGFAGSEGGMAYKTTDGGLSWNVVTTLNALPTDAFFSMFNEGSNLYVLSYDSTLYVSTDAGATFTSSQYLPSGNIAIVMRAGAVFGSTIYLAGDLGSFYKSTNNGTSWQSPTKLAKVGYIQDVYANNSGKIIAVGEPSIPSTIGEQIIVSDDGGQNWTSISLSSLDADLRSIKMIDANTGYTVGSSGSIWKTTNGGYDWNLYSSPTTEQAFNAVDFYNAQYGMTAGNNGEVWKTTDGGTTWTSLTGLIPSDYFNGIAMIDSISALAIGFSVYKTTDGGLTWTTISPTFPDSPLSKIKMFNQSVGVIVGPTGFFGFNPFVYKTTDGGDTWNSMNFPFSTTDKLYNVEFRTADDIVVVGNNGGVFHTSDNGATWTQFNLGLMNFFSGQMLGVAFSGPNEVVVGGAASQLIKVELNNVVPVELVSFTCEVSNPNIRLHWITASELNNQGFEVERKTSESNLWQTIGNVPGRGTTTNSTDYYFNDDNLAPAVYNYRIKQVDYDGSIEYSQVINADLTTPNTFRLEQNYPNPFNPSTSISYSIPNNSFVTLKVYDILGNEVATLVNQTQAAGNYIFSFDASNLSNGVYLYSIKADNFSDVKKMIFMK
jgi:photosystem II stability/assembly factor-like uncharacterized protein